MLVPPVNVNVPTTESAVPASAATTVKRLPGAHLLFPASYNRAELFEGAESETLERSARTPLVSFINLCQAAA